MKINKIIHILFGIVAGMNRFVRVRFAFNLENIDIGISLLKILANGAKSGPKMFYITQNISHLRYCISKIPVTVSYSSDSIVALAFHYVLLFME
jgi:hypothetical protein